MRATSLQDHARAHHHAQPHALHLLIALSILPPAGCDASRARFAASGADDLVLPVCASIKNSCSPAQPQAPLLSTSLDPTPPSLAGRATRACLPPRAVGGSRPWSACSTCSRPAAITTGRTPRTRRTLGGAAQLGPRGGRCLWDPVGAEACAQPRVSPVCARACVPGGWSCGGGAGGHTRAGARGRTSTQTHSTDSNTGCRGNAARFGAAPGICVDRRFQILVKLS